MDSLKAHQDVRAHKLGPTPLAEPPPSHEEMLDEDNLKEDDLELLWQLENSSMKSKERKTRHKKGSKKLQKWETSEQGIETFSTLSEKRENASPLHDPDNISGSLKKKKRDRKRATLEFKERAGDANLAQEVCGPSHSSSDGRKRKKKKQQVHFEVSSSGYNYWRDENQRPAQETLSIGDTHRNTNPKPKAMATVTSHRKKEPLAIQQSNIAGVVSCSTPLSSPTASSRMIPGGDKLGVPRRAEDINSVSDHSQDLFITQKLFLPARASSSSSGCSPPLAQEQGGAMGWPRSHSSNSVRLSSQFSGSAHRSSDHSDVIHGHSAPSTEKSTQTDDVFSYLALMTFLNKTKVLETCSQKPLDLSLPSRIRAASVVLNVSENDVIFIGSTSQDLRQAAKKSKGKRWIPSQESRLVQSVLNSSYFFKGKGDHNDNTPITPLLKITQQSKKRTRKSVLKRPRKRELVE